MSLNDASRLNNEGVYFLLDGSHHHKKAAVNSFVHSLAMIRRLIIRTKEEDVLIDDAGAKNASNILSEEQSPMFACAANAPFHSTIPISSFGGDTTEKRFLFQNAILLNPSFVWSEVQESDDDDVNTTTLHAACTIFNLALLYHSMGITANDYVFLRKAEKMYRLCSSKLLLPPGSADDTSLLILLAATNNLCQLQFERCAFDKAKEALQCISSFLNQTPAAGEADQNAFCPAEFMPLLSNLILLVEALNPAPAA